MTAVGLAVALGTPDTVGVVPITTNNIPALISTAQSTAETADVFAATAQTDVGTADTNVGTVKTDLATVVSDFNAFAAQVIAVTGDTYNTSTMQFTFGGSTGLTHTQVASFFAYYNTSSTALLTAQTDAATAKTATALAVTDMTTLKADTAAADAAADALSISTGGNNLYTVFDTTIVTTAAAFNGACTAMLAFLRKQGILT
jgi:hypothetical protein